MNALFSPDFIEKDGYRYWREDLVTVSAAPSRSGPANFEAFWTAYPRRAGKKLGKEDARKAYLVALKCASHDALVAAVKVYAAECGDFAVDAHRWLKHKRWLDYAGEGPDVTPEKFNKWLAEQINGDAYLPQTLVTPAKLGALIQAGLVTYARAKQRGLA